MFSCAVFKQTDISFHGQFVISCHQHFKLSGAQESKKGDQIGKNSGLTTDKRINGQTDRAASD